MCVNMIPGDLVRYAPVGGYAWSASKIGVIIDLVRLDSRGSKYFKVLWRDGTIRNDIYDLDLKYVKGSGHPLVTGTR